MLFEPPSFISKNPAPLASSQCSLELHAAVHDVTSTQVPAESYFPCDLLLLSAQPFRVRLSGRAYTGYMEGAQS